MPDRKEYMRQYRLKKKMQNCNKPVKRAKTAAEHQKEYRARKKAKKLAAASGMNNPEDNIKIVKTAAEYQREYRARMKASKPRKSEDDIKIVKTAAEYQREYRARMKASKPRKSENNIKIVKTAAEYQREYRARLKAKKLEAAGSMSMDNIKKVKTAAERQRECRQRKKAINPDDAGSKSKNTFKTAKAAAERQRECRDMLRKHILYRDACLRPLLDLGLPHCSPQSPDLCGSPLTQATGLLNIVSPAHLWSPSTSFAQPWAPMQNFIVSTFDEDGGETPVSTGTVDRVAPDVPTVKSEPRSPTESDDEKCFSDVNVKTETPWIPTIKVEAFPELPVEFEPRADAEEGIQDCTKIDIKQENEIEGNLNKSNSFAVKSEPSSPAGSYQEEENEGRKLGIDIDMFDTDMMQDCLDLSRNSKQHRASFKEKDDPVYRNSAEAPTAL